MVKRVKNVCDYRASEYVAQFWTIRWIEKKKIVKWIIFDLANLKQYFVTSAREASFWASLKNLLFFGHFNLSRNSKQTAVINMTRQRMLQKLLIYFFNVITSLIWYYFVFKFNCSFGNRYFWRCMLIYVGAYEALSS